MAKPPKPGSPGSTSLAKSLGLDGFFTPDDDLGLSLDELSQAYASLLGGGDDPYAPAKPPTDGLQADAPTAQILARIDAAERAAAETYELASELIAEQELEAQAERSPASELPGGSPRPRTDSTSAPAADAPAASTAASTAAGPSRRHRPPPPSDALAARPRRTSSWAAACEISPRTILEAMLFVGDPDNRPLSAKQVASLMRGVLPREIDELVRELNETYESEGAPYEIVSDGPGYRLQLRAEFGSLRDAFLGRIREVRLAPAAVDILAIVAYNQPIGRDEIDKLRNKASGALLSQLVRRGLLRVEIPDERGRKPIYYTTDRFLELFGLESLDDLPRSQDIERTFS